MRKRRRFEEPADSTSSDDDDDENNDNVLCSSSSLGIWSGYTPGKTRGVLPGSHIRPMTLLRYMRQTFKYYNPSHGAVVPSVFHPRDCGYIPHTVDPATGDIDVAGGWQKKEMRKYVPTIAWPYYRGSGRENYTRDSLFRREQFGYDDAVYLTRIGEQAKRRQVGLVHHIEQTAEAIRNDIAKLQ